MHGGSNVLKHSWAEGAGGGGAGVVVRSWDAGVVPRSPAESMSEESSGPMSPTKGYQALLGRLSGSSGVYV